VSLVEQVKSRVLEPAVLRVYQWRGDPVARVLSPETKLDPYPLWADLRRRGPLFRSPLGVWATSSHATATKVLRDPRFSSSPVHQSGYKPPVYPPDDPRAGLPAADLLTLDPPDHTRLRRLVSKAFNPKVIPDLEAWIREVADRLLDGIDAPAGFDLIETFALPLPIAVICHLLGVPIEDQAKFRVWGHDIATTLEPQTDVAAKNRTRASELALTAYLRDLVEKRRTEPDDSLLSFLVAAEEEGDRLSSGELVATAALLLVAGFETTVNLIGNATVALLGEPEQWRRLGEEPALVPAAVEELLRYDSPVQMTSRIATDDIELDGATLPKGAAILVAIGGANRDPDVFDHPDQLRIDRPEASRHLAFSLGIHHCLGAALARLEGRVAIDELTRRYPKLEVVGIPTRRQLLVLRGYEQLAVRTPSSSMISLALASPEFREPSVSMGEQQRSNRTSVPPRAERSV
jgi:cytochrome P450